MRRISFFKKYLISNLFFIFCITSYAGPIPWTVVANSKSIFSMASYDTVSIQYTVTNQTNKAKHLIMTPISGVQQITSGSGACGSIISLPNKGSSCTLYLQVIGDQVLKNIYTGPNLCENGNSFQCYGPDKNNVLNVSIIQPSPYQTAYDYTVRFYPRLLSWLQGDIDSVENKLGSPDTVTPEYKMVVAINDDTIYASTFIELSSPQIVTIPAYSNHYSVLILDVFGSVLYSVSTPTTSGASYALVGPDFNGTLPAGVSRINLPYNSGVFIVRADRYSNNVDVSVAAELFVRNLRMQSLAAYEQSPNSGGETAVKPVSFYAAPIKRTADQAVFASPVNFLSTIQTALSSSLTQPITTSDQLLISQFNTYFNGASASVLSNMTLGAQDAHNAIINNWRSHLDSHKWIHFNNMGNWGTNYLDRASANEYIQYGNNLAAAYYAHIFVDRSNILLDSGTLDNPVAYRIRFDVAQIPPAQRFWSLTAYTPEDIQLVENSLNKYVVASYTPGLEVDIDGSITIYIQNTQPTAHVANWLPVPPGQFNLMLRIYGPTGTALAGTYLPPEVLQWPEPLP